ncbi:Transmembrane protein (plasmid) [Cupriavidus sp. H19C3]|uniref:hypothetical protein n=1 Tax=Cupriavidus sp. H19C3 TaxID=3241603 RepID=UPI003BF79B25
MADWKRFTIVVLLLTFGFATVFILLGGLASGYSLQNVLFLGSAGFFVGAIGAPEIEPKLFRFPRLWQVSFSVLAGVLVAVHLQVGALGYSIAVLVGVILGYFAPFWIKHIQIP